MKFKLNINISEKDYFDFNTFVLVRSPYGKKQMRNIRLLLLAIFVFGAIYVFLNMGISSTSVVTAVLLAILALLFQLSWNKFFAWSLKCQLKSLKKSGKLAYSPESVMEFYDDKFVESTDENKTEQKYTAIERISIVDNKIMYIHINNSMAFLLPFSSFESEGQYHGFLEFIKTRCSKIDIY